MNTADCAIAAYESLQTNPLRSALTALGIVIGVGAVVAMVSVGLGAQHRIDEAIKDIGANMLVIGNGSRTADGRQTGRGQHFTLTESDAAALAREIPYVQVAAGSIGGTGRIVAGNRNWYSHLWGITPDYFIAHNWTVASGRAMTEAEVRASAKVAILGKSVAEQLFDQRNPLGQTVRIERVPFTVIGVLSSKGTDPWLGSDQDDLVLMPLSTAKRRIIGAHQARLDLLAQITLKVTDPAALDTTVRMASNILRQRHKLLDTDPDDFFISNVTDALHARSESSRVMSRLLASIAAIALLVGGIGIMNIMLVTVRERTREIGLRMAVGARARDIQTQFLFEALMLSLLGGIVGILSGMGGAAVISQVAGWPVRMGVSAIAAAFFLSLLIGLFFGYYPAQKAARMDPIDALREQ